MVFYWGADTVVFLKQFHVESTADLAVTCLVFLGLAVLLESLKCLRQVSAVRTGNRTNGVSMCSKAHVVQTSLHCGEFLLGYALMLAVMTYNAWFLVSVVTGSTAGFLICKYLDVRQKLIDAMTKPENGVLSEQNTDIHKPRPENGHDSSHVTGDDPLCGESRRQLQTPSGNPDHHEVVELLSSL